MHRLRIAAFVVLGGPAAVVELVDRLRRDHPTLGHRQVPRPSRLAELYANKPGKGRYSAREPESEALRELVSRGEDAVPDLVTLLQDETRRRVAAYVLAEIGGEGAARALWAEYRMLMRRVQVRSLVRVTEDEQGRRSRLLKGEKILNVDGEYYL